MLYQTLDDIQAEKQRLREAIDGKCEAIRTSWDTLFHSDGKPAMRTPTQRLLGYANTAAGMFDGLMLGWKLYRRFGGSGSLFKKKRRK